MGLGADWTPGGGHAMGEGVYEEKCPRTELRLAGVLIILHVLFHGLTLSRP